LGLSSGIGPCFKLAGGFTSTLEENEQRSAKYSLVQYKQQANPLLSKNNYTPLVISRNGKNKKLTLI
jgi:hypothetical protein